MFRALDDIKIVELSTATAGPAASKILVEYGADCIVVEPRNGIPNRNLPPHFDFSFTHKKSIIIDIKTEQGMEAMHRLISSADVFLSNYRYRSLKKLGLDYDSLKDRYPQLICAYLTGYGEFGAMKDAPGFDNTAFWGRAGLLHDMIDAATNSLPVSPSAVGDITSGAMLAMGILAAIRNRDRFGVGTKVTTSLFEVGLYLNHSQMIFNQNGVEYPKSRLKPNRAMSNSYPAKDGYFYLITLNFEKDFNKLLTSIGRGDLVGDPRWTCMQDTQGEGAQELRVILDEAFSKYTLAELREIFRQNDMAFGEFCSCSDAIHDPQAEANGYLSRIRYEDGREIIIPNSPVQFNNETAMEVTPAVPAGHNTREILQDVGYSEEEIQSMIDQGCVRTETK